MLLWSAPLGAEAATSDLLSPELRTGDEIVVAGRFFHTGTPVVLWIDAGGYDAYRVERRFVPQEKASWDISRLEDPELSTPNRYGLRKDRLTPEEVERVRGGGWDLRTLRKVVDQFVIHYDACGTSRQCFRVLHDQRGLSAHFLLDIDGTIYQTLDLKERAWHATTSNSRSIGIEIANIGAFSSGKDKSLSEWYDRDRKGGTRLTIPERFGDGGVRTRGFSGTPARPQPVRGKVQGKDYVQYDFTPQQYRALARLTAAVCGIFPNIKCDAPRDREGVVRTSRLPDEQLETFQGVLGHLHVQAEKIDPGPAFQWDRLLKEARRLIRHDREFREGQGTSLGHMRRER
jgi:N-acetylmuramoyl-L-alanine amidase